MQSMHPTHRYLIWLALLLAVIVLILIAAFFIQRNSQANGSAAISAPAPTPADYVTVQKGFQYLVSYTSTGFSPTSLSVTKGETVRFTNNSDTTLNLPLTGATPLAHGQYFEHTFTVAGDFIVSDGGTNKIQVTVK